MDTINKDTFFRLIENFEFVPLTQSRGWCEMIADAERWNFFTDNRQNPKIACMGYVMKRFGLRMLQIDGECLLNKNLADSHIVRNFYIEIAKTDFDIIEVNSSLKYSALYEIGIRQAGFLRPVGLFSTSLSILIDLQKPVKYSKQRQTNLLQAEKCPQHLVFVPKPVDKDFEDYMLIHSEMLGRKQFFDRLDFRQLKALFQKDDFLLFFVENEKKHRIAGNVVYARNGEAIGVFSCTSPEGKTMYSGFFMKDKIYNFLREKSFNFFDYGRISPAAHKKNSLFVAKDGVKGEYIQYCGEFSFYKKQIYRVLMYFVKKYLFKKVEV